jgi:hypothetical protein
MRRAIGPPDLLHNMSVPPTSVLQVRRANHPGRRFRVDLTEQLSRGTAAGQRRRLGERGWELAWTLLTKAGDGPPRPHRKHRTREALVEHLEEALRRARVPHAVGVFLGEVSGAGPARRLGPAATLAVLARRSGPLYLPARGLDPSLADPQPLVLFFPEDLR